jgi:hypothetical protein
VSSPKPRPLRVGSWYFQRYDASYTGYVAIWFFGLRREGVLDAPSSVRGTRGVAVSITDAGTTIRTTEFAIPDQRGDPRDLGAETDWRWRRSAPERVVDYAERLAHRCLRHTDCLEHPELGRSCWSQRFARPSRDRSSNARDRAPRRAPARLVEHERRDRARGRRHEREATRDRRREKSR